MEHSPNSSSVTEPDALVLDLDLLRDIAGNDRELIRELLDLYIADVQQRIENFLRNLFGTDGTSAIREIHTIKGSSATIGAQRMQNCAMELEHKLRAHYFLHELMGLIDQLKAEFELVKAEIEKVSL